jgi:cytochrome c553
VTNREKWANASAVMAPLVANLSDTDIRDLAAYYAYLPRPSDFRPASEVPPRIVSNGAPMRGIAPCGACHGELDSKPGAAWLEGQAAAYLRAQLVAFASGARRNDIGEQMRNVARRMTADEIDAQVGTTVSVHRPTRFRSRRYGSRCRGRVLRCRQRAAQLGAEPAPPIVAFPGGGE